MVRNGAPFEPSPPALAAASTQTSRETTFTGFSASVVPDAHTAAVPAFTRTS